MAEQSDRQRRIRDHLAKSSGDFIQPKVEYTSPDRKKKIMNHVDRTRG